MKCHDEEGVYYTARATASRHAAPEAVREGGPGEGGNGCGEGGEERERQKRAQEREADGEGGLPGRSAPGPFPVGLGEQGEVVRRGPCHERRELRLGVPDRPRVRPRGREGGPGRGLRRPRGVRPARGPPASPRSSRPATPGTFRDRRGRPEPPPRNAGRWPPAPGPVLTEYSHSGVRTVTTAVLLMSYRSNASRPGVDVGCAPFSGPPPPFPRGSRGRLAPEPSGLALALGRDRA